ncbi:cyclic nucleotide-binding domain-containing protein [Mycobacterium sp. Aquia_213]|uniref:cyclic nucleotide-binding domain-containing protein n=1 Tax=Mycobacterium sp. Aquia_213 TaxID=2991728 RepID=UPI00226FB763|nr:cyclic nucleotide-binding domain-containing protein [Mycobacterium sp. Aquia_213]WAC93131.1 cyclic nucleotide-binding domain-containing protein [Mycobacterium sp. Aquia_213]
MAEAPARASRWSAFRNAFSNPNIARVEASIAAGVVAHVAWVSTMLVVTFELLGPIGPGWFLFVRQITGAISAPVYAALAGRFRRERVLAGSIVARGVAVALVIPLLELHTATALLFLVLALEGFTQSAPKALHDALLPWLADSPAQLVAANAVAALLETSGVLVGAGVAAVALGVSGPPAALATIVVFCALGAWPLLTIRGIDTRVRNEGSRVANELAGGIGVLRRSTNARVVVAVMAITASLTGIAQSIVASIASDLLHMGSSGTPVLIGAVGIGGLVGGIASLSLGRHSMSLPMVVGFLACAVVLFALAVTSTVALAIPLLSTLGIGIAYQIVCGRTLLQRSASGRSLDLLAGINAVIAVSVVGVAGFCAAQVNAAIGVRGTLRVAAGLALLGAIYGLFRVLRVERRSPVRRQELDAIRSVEAFRPLSVAAADQLASALIAVAVAEADVVVRQGDSADDMFLIGSGGYETVVDGEPVRTLHDGDHFGEIALLFDVPRTATVRCLQAGTLWRLRREDFLRAITGNSTTQDAIKAIADQRLEHAGSTGLKPKG